MAKIKSISFQTKSNTKLDKIVKPPTFIQSITTLHGINYFKVKKGKSLIVWTLSMIFHIALTIFFLVVIKRRYNSDHIVTKIYSDWTVDKVPFPAVSICNFNKVSVNESKTIRNILLKNGVSQEEVELFFYELYFLTDFSVGSIQAHNQTKIMNVLKKHYYNIDIIMFEVHQKCKNLLVYCEFNSKKKRCEDIFSITQTYSGFCCTFNFNGIDDQEVDPLMAQDDDFEYYYDQSPDGEDFATNIIATSQSGGSSGLRVVFNVEPEDYGPWALAPSFGAKILINDPNDYVETRVIYRYMAIGESMAIKVEPMIFNCEDNLRFVDVEKRGCWFHDEVNLLNTNRYSYETCSTECRIRNYREYCGCIPYKYPGAKETRVCDFSDLPCLHHMRVYWDNIKTPCVPKCYKECRDKWYSVVTDVVPFLSESYSQDIMAGRNVSELAALRVYYLRSTCTSYTMSLLTDANTFIATYGGIFSLCFGASIITFMELAYLCLASFMKIMWNKIHL